jgi:hypothetical protein
MESRNRTVRYRSRISGLGAALLLSMQISAGHTAAAAVLRDMDMERKGEVRKGKGEKKPRPNRLVVFLPHCSSRARAQYLSTGGE